MESVPEPPAIFDELTLGGNVGATESAETTRANVPVGWVEMAA